MMDSALITLALACAIIGASVGMSGIGGFLIVPAMLLAGAATPVEAVLAALLANLAATLVTGVMAVLRRHVIWTSFAWLVVGGLLAAAASFWVVRFLSPELTRIIVALFLTSIGLVVLLGQTRRQPRRQATHAFETIGIGALAQISAVMAGIGGPAVTVPLLTAQGKDQLVAIGTGLLHGVFSSVIGVVVLLAASGSIALTANLIVFPAIMVVFAFLTNLFRSRFTSHLLLRRVVGVASIAGGLFTLFIR